MSTKWKMRLALALTVALAVLLSGGALVYAHRPNAKPQTLSAAAARADMINEVNPLVVSATPSMRIVRAVINDRLYLIVFQKHNGVWFYAASKPAASQPG
jgi:hypothetical protein